MPSIVIQDYRVFNDFRAEGMPLLVGNIGEHVKIEVDFKFELFAKATPAEPLQFAPVNQLTPDFIQDASGQNRFAEFFVGDSIVVSNAISPANDGTYIVIQKVSGNVIQVDSNVISELDTAATIINESDINGITFKTAFIENNEVLNFLSKETGIEQVWKLGTVDSTNTTYQSLVPQGLKDWQLGGVRIKGQNVGGEQSYTLEIDTYIHPLFIAGQFTDLSNDIAPDGFIASESLKHVFQILLQPDLSDINRNYIYTRSSTLGNVGWFDENFNGGVNNYSVSLIEYFKDSDSSTLTSVELTETDKTNVEITVLNTVDSPFVDSVSKVAVSFWELPSSSSEYQNNNVLLSNNFNSDTALNTLSAGAVNGLKFGSARQVISNFRIDFISSSEILVKFDVDFGSDAFDSLVADPTRRYVLAVNVADESEPSATSDRVQLKADARAMNYDASNQTLVTYDNRFLIHPQNDVDDSESEIGVLPEDIVVARTMINFQPKAGERILKITGEIVAFNSATEQEFILENFSQVIPQTPIVNTVQFFNFAIARHFKIPIGEIRNDIEIIRRTDLDSPPNYKVLFKYPFSFRWEHWLTLAGVNSTFFDVSEPNNGFNHDWERYELLPDWKIYWRVNTDVDDNGLLYTLSDKFPMDSADYDENSLFGTNTIETFDADTLTPLLSGGNYHVLGYKDTLVEVEFEYLGGSPPPVNEVWFVIRMETFEQGGRFGITRLSNIYDTDGNSLLKSSDAITDPLRVKVTKSGSFYKGSCLVDFTKLPTGKTEFSISGRIGFTLAKDCIETEDGQPIEVEDGTDCLEPEF